MKTLMCFPLNPSSIRDMSEPTPPDSRIFIPGSLVRASLRFRVVFLRSLVSTATALKAERLIFPTPPAAVTTDPSSDSDCGCTATLVSSVSPGLTVTLYSSVL